jgi:arginyl-tRNA synthetase
MLWEIVIHVGFIQKRCIILRSRESSQFSHYIKKYFTLIMLGEYLTKLRSRFHQTYLDTKIIIHKNPLMMSKRTKIIDRNHLY